jgi:hypothetical protein
LGKVAIISLTCRRDEGIPSALLEHELREYLMHNDRITRKWFVEKISILNDAEVAEARQVAQ